MILIFLILFSLYIIITEKYLFGLFILALVNLILNKNVKIKCLTYNQTKEKK